MQLVDAHRQERPLHIPSVEAAAANINHLFLEVGARAEDAVAARVGHPGGVVGARGHEGKALHVQALLDVQPSQYLSIRALATVAARQTKVDIEMEWLGW